VTAEKLGEPPTVSRAVAVSRTSSLGLHRYYESLRVPTVPGLSLAGVQFEGGANASEIYMQQSEPPYSRKSAVREAIFSLASLNGAQPIDQAEV
jgi:hypothetical protein